MTSEVCEPLQKLTLVKADWEWNGMYQDLYDRAKKIIKKEACMKFFDTSRPLYLQTDASHVGLIARLLQVRDSMSCDHDDVPDNTTLCPIAFPAKVYQVSCGATAI